MVEESQRDFANVPVVWEPDENSGKEMRSFMKKISKKYNVEIKDFWDMHKWSIEHLEEFWAEIWHMSGIIYSKPYDKVMDPSVPMNDHQEWFAGAKMNFAENLLKYRDDHLALIVAGEDRETEKVTYAQMYEEAKLYAAALRKQGVKKGDRVSCFMSNRKEAVIAMIATTSLAAIWVGALPLMGSQAVLHRFKQVEPKILFSVDRFPHDRENRDMLPKLKEIADGLPSLEKVIIVASKPESKLKDISGIRTSCFLDDFLETGKRPDGSVPDMIFEQVPFTHPVFINYTSGTTGLPKALVHNSGTLLSVYRDFELHCCSGRQCWLSMSPVGWGTWNMLATMHSLGITVVLFEGLPYFFSPTFLWDMVDEFKISIMLIQPSVLEDMEKKGCYSMDHHDLSSLEVIMSGGSVVKPQVYDMIAKAFRGRNIIFSSAYGSTELLGCGIVIDRTLKIYKEEIPTASFGIDIQCMNDEGISVVGELGEMVIAKHTPSLPLGIWGDTDRSLFKKAYFEKYPGKFSVSDLIIINPITRGIFICGRSDDTLKPKGCRFGSSEIYSIVDPFPEVFDSLCVSQYNKNKDERVVLFLKMQKGSHFNQDLVRRIREAIARELSPRHVPEVILETAEIPHNMNGKKMEITVKKIINKLPYNPETVINPGCLKNFEDVPELLGF